MAGLARQAMILTLSRFANYGLMLIGPILLVRILPVEAFGRYREFVLYASVLQSLAGFAISDSLLFLIPSHAASPWRMVRQTALMTFAVSSVTILVIATLDISLHGAILGGYVLPVSVYILFFANVDFWEYYWLANHQPKPVVAYTLSRLTARMITVIAVAALTHRVQAIIWSLVALEALRLAGAAILWRRLDRSASEQPIPGAWRDQLRFCVPAGLSIITFMLNRNLGSVAVTKVMGAAALAQFTIGLYGEPILLAIRNSISTVLLPEMVRRGSGSSGHGLSLWKRSTVLNCILLLPFAVILARYAEPLVLSVFRPAYRPAAPVLQMYSLVIVLECFDVSGPLRAINKTRPLVGSGVIALGATALGLYMLLPRFGLVGAMATLIVSTFIEVCYLAWCVMRFYNVRVGDLIPWGGVLKVSAAAVGASLVFATSRWDTQFGLAGIVVASVVYCGLFVVLLHALGVEEAVELLARVRSQFRFASRGARP